MSSHIPSSVSPLRRLWYKWKMLRLPWRRKFLVGFDLSGNTYWEFLLRGQTPGPGSRYRRIVQYPRGTHHGDVKVSPAWHQWLRHTRRDPPSIAEQLADVERQTRIRQLAALADARWEAKPKLTDAPATPSSPLAALAGQAFANTFGTTPPPASVSASAGAPTLDAQPMQPEQDTLTKLDIKRWRWGETFQENVPQQRGTVGDRDWEAAEEREEAWRKTEEAAVEARRKREKATAAAAAAQAGCPDPWKQVQSGKGTGPGETWQPESWKPTARPKN
ncbi:uncharacterized protein CTHT_0023460 [Thermochaetoides thermophila DSM 1495]|uniref:Uncharacterized protein n=1 Tax=Chaetomium thermophilum (strain DSM 1495 / CBS 144.50 / IMI 039719) TaxID=759272 RepID=G0S4T5_CHATD|nr:hypothetical protein CTHT_0023460 [Thermochaetoides thermophila DSM 1495]EGS20514.1 hypothetical protein CTHT_0023460 [Thermochaetoides thermophila DSM 1495]